MNQKIDKAVEGGLEVAMRNVDAEITAEDAAQLVAVKSHVSRQEPVEYERLARILRLAFEQSAFGKGKERHATGPTGFKPWLDQPINTIGRMVGPGYAAGQVQKKVQEAVTMHGNSRTDAAQQEVLGAIVYCAALWQHFEEAKK